MQSLWPFVFWGIIGISLMIFGMYNLIKLIEIMGKGTENIRQNIRNHNRNWYIGFTYWAIGLSAITFSFIGFKLLVWKLCILLAFLGLLEMFLGERIMKKSKRIVPIIDEEKRDIHG